ncbi:DUF3311 domain-containing protein [Natrarchaeobius chitinivorans]|uniref:DUF3311 domain-containing protein n=1 Tax=Natrarchaeobius chitinivorans TaxID=1679083 RepID=A0A3N6LU97_NATCH|nr:DUF3311 domain-containing protein [Natrarchaeobius chitinivorans]RQG92207.1 DUF3311 domain-containing protein [Natrarchaeobius chitinivorans]
MRRRELAGWAAVGIVLCTFAIPWFLWGDGTVIAGIPLWLWWHIGWMGLASVVFWLFASRAWGIGIETEPRSASSRDDRGGDRSATTAAGGDEA